VKNWNRFVIVVACTAAAWNAHGVSIAQTPTTRSRAADKSSTATRPTLPNSARSTKEITNSVGMTLELIPAGQFMMGGGESAEDLVKNFPQYGMAAEFFADEFPQHRVRITKPFYCSRFETTNGQFRQFVAATGYQT